MPTRQKVIYTSLFMGLCFVIFATEKKVNYIKELLLLTAKAQSR